MKSLNLWLYQLGAKHEISDTKMCKKWFSNTFFAEYYVRISIIPKKKVQA